VKSNKLLSISLVALAALAIGFAVGRFLSGRSDASLHSDDSGAAADAAGPVTWTCSMHPQIQQPDPGDCPICGMVLIPLEEDGPDPGPRAMTMSESALALADIQTAPVTREFPAASVRMFGTLEYDQTRVRSLTARFPARIERLFVNYTGVPVRRGEHLALVYSPELLTAQREFLTAHRADPDGALAAAAREKLRLWDLLPGQIDEILRAASPSDRFEIQAPVGGVVAEQKVQEGDYVQTGQALFRIVDLGQLWLMLKAYESDLPWLHYGQQASFTVESYPGETFTGTIAFIEPELDRRTRTATVRVNVPNPGGRLKPGMFARGRVEARLAGEGRVHVPGLAGKWISPMHPEIVKDGPGQCDVCGMDLVPAEDLGYVTDEEGEAPLVIPASAVLRTGRRAVVYVAVPGRDRPTFEGREIVLGPRAGDVYLVQSGLSGSERVVTNGAFKIDSALQIQARPSMMSMAPPAPEPEAVTLEPAAAAALMPDYFALAAALAGDDPDAARTALFSMMEKTGHHGALPDLIHAMLEGGSLEAVRRPHFEVLSNAFIAAVRAGPEAFAGNIFLLHCPMVHDDRPDPGADWLQPDDKLLNPYFGAMMLRCGEVREQLK
jgi:membrane fusion protein, copper/silver efflux system